MATDTEQESLIVVSNQSDLMQVRDFSESGPDLWAVDRIEQKIHLLNCLGHLAGARMLDGLVTIGPDNMRVVDQYGEEASRMVLASEQARINHIQIAKWEFAWGTGRFALEDSGVMTAWEARALTSRLFSDFLKKYHLPDDRSSQKDYRHRLEEQVRELQSDRTFLNREQGIRPYQTTPQRSESTTTAEERRELSFLDTKQRLEAMVEDPRARFLPFTHREKNVVMTFLDYLDNPDYPLGINNQFFEVHIHQQKPAGAGVSAGVRAVESIVWEIGDYLTNANASLHALQELQSALQGCSPRVVLAEEIGEEHPGLAPLIRYMNVQEYLKTGRVTGLKRDPLRTAEERWTREGPGKHKTVHDQYSRPDHTPAFGKYLKKRPSSITIGEAQGVLLSAITNETMRIDFMAQRLRDASALEQYLTMQPVAEAVRTSLGVLQEVA